MKNFLNIFMGSCLGYYVGHCIFTIWNYHRHPEFYAMRSVPWYTSLWVYGLMVLAVVLVCTTIKIVLKHIEKNKSSE